MGIEMLRNAALASALLSGPLAAGTIRVPDGEPDLASALATAQAGDLILVAPGTYAGPGFRGLDVTIDNLTIRGIGGSSQVEINCQSADRWMTVSSTGVLVDGLTIVDAEADVGFSPPGQAIDAQTGSDLTLVDCVFESCGFFYGGPNFGPSGGAVSARGVLTVDRCRFDGNQGENGGAIYLSGATARIERSVFVDNVGRALFDDGLTGGELFGQGGAIAAFSSELVVASCVFEGNDAEDRGAAIVAVGPPVAIDQCTFTRNVSAVSPFGSTSEVLDLFVTGGGGAGSFTRSVVFGNVAPINTFASSNIVDVENCLIEGGWPGGIDVIDVDPLFVPGGTALQAGSPCIDRGPFGPGDTTHTDVAGAPRHVDGLLDGSAQIDLGAHEFSHATITSPDAPLAAPGETIGVVVQSPAGHLTGVLVSTLALPAPVYDAQLGDVLYSYGVGFPVFLGPYVSNGAAIPTSIAIPAGVPQGTRFAFVPGSVLGIGGGFGAALEFEVRTP